MVVGDALFAFSWLSIGNSVIDDSLELRCVNLLEVGKIALVRVSPIEFGVNISLEVLLFELFPPVSEFLDSSEGEHSLFIGIFEVSTHGVEANDVLHLAGHEGLWHDRIPFFLFWDKFFFFI